MGYFFIAIFDFRASSRAVSRGRAPGLRVEDLPNMRTTTVTTGGGGTLTIQIRPPTATGGIGTRVSGL